MSTVYQKKARIRIIILGFFFMLWLVALVSRLIQLQVFEHPRLKTEVLEQNQNRNTIHPKRGTIFDCTGNILARSLPVQSVFFSPFKGEPYRLQLEKIAKLKKVLNLSENELQKIYKRIQKNASFIWVKRKIGPQKEEEVKKLSLGGIYFMEENKRFYPHGKLAAHLLGRVNIDDIGASGIEYKYNSVLAGKEGEHLILRDAKKREYQFETLREPEAGKDLILTIDETIQYYAEKELERVMRKTEASWGTVIISQPATGEILAMANYPTADLNNPPPKPLTLDRNKAIHHNFEPGSTFKIVTASAALEAGKVNLTDSFDCSKGFIRVAGKTIRDHELFGVLSFPEVIIHSSNVGTIQFGQSIGEEIFFDTIKAFGFGQKTGIDLPAEEKGIFRPLDSWTQISTSSLSIGYEISVTATQLLQAINAIANKGFIISPKVVKKILSSADEITEKPYRRRRLISEKTASILSSILQNSVQRGTGFTARIKGYKVAGKTGTAQKFDSTIGGYSSTVHISSFAGFVPADNPALSMIVVIDEPKGPYTGGEVAAPLFREIASLVLRYLRIPKQEDRLHTVIAERRLRRVKR
jgi:cell division protein FtsI (penicillin-binding protein 3)